MAGPTQINSTTEDVSLYVGSNESYMRIKHGHHIDTYTRIGDGRDLMLCYHTGNAVRIGNSSGKLAIGMAANNFQFACNGAGQYSSFVEATSFKIGSDQRLKENVQEASLDECTRLMLAVRPVSYILKANGEAQIGYISNAFKREAQDAYRNSIVGDSEDANGPLVTLDYCRIVPILHGALLSALARIEALESRLT